MHYEVSHLGLGVQVSYMHVTVHVFAT